MEYAKTLIKRRNPAASIEHDVGDEESWTFISDETDPELIRRIAEWEPMRLGHARQRSASPKLPDAAAPAGKHGLGVNFLRRSSKA